MNRNNPAMAIYINESLYHGYAYNERPRPWGRAMWVFSRYPIGSPQPENENTIVSPNMTYTEAKIWIRKEVREKWPQCETIYILKKQTTH